MNSKRAIGCSYQLMTRLLFGIAVGLVTLLARPEEACDVLRGAAVIAQDEQNTYLGKVSNKYDGDSIFNEYGTYGSPYNGQSIWNTFGTYGSEFSSYSPFNAFTSTPPMLVKNQKIVGYLTANKAKQPSITPNLLKALCADMP